MAEREQQKIRAGVYVVVLGNIDKPAIDLISSRPDGGAATTVNYSDK